MIASSNSAAILRIRRLLAGSYFIEVTPAEAELMVYRYADVHRLEGEELRQMFLKFETKLACEMIDPKAYLPGSDQ